MRFILVATLVCGTALSAQSNAELMANDHYSRSHDYDLLHQRIEVRNFDWDSTSFDGVVTTSLRALRAGFDSVVIDAGALLDIQSVMSAAAPGRRVAGPKLQFDHVRDTLVVHLARRAEFGDTVRFTVTYHARIESGKGITFIEADSSPPRRPRQLWSQGEDDNNHDWFPTYDFPNDKCTWELIATVPAGFTAVSNGRLIRDIRNRDGTRTMDWSQETPSATYLASIIVAPLVRIADQWRRTPVDYYVYREDSALARPLFRRTPDMINVYSKLTGVDYPWPKYAQTTVADFFGGMENVSATTLVDWLPDARAYADRPWYWYELIAHELAHQWFGDYVTTANWANMWLNEGFATFMPGQYWQATNGPHAGEDYYLEQYHQFMDIDADRRMPLASLGSNNIYPKGALVLEMLRKQLGDARFWAGIQRYLRDHAFGVATSDDLRQAFLKATGENLDRFWDEWVYQAGYPRFTVVAQWDSVASVVTLTVKQTQTDSAVADSSSLRYTTPAVFHAPVIIRVGTAQGAVVGRAQLDAREQTIRVEGVHSAPNMVVFDDGNTILKTLVFDQPTGWLATQLRTDGNLWNRRWVMDQLASRTADSMASAALSAAATSADYFLTRARAAELLAGFSSDRAGPALRKAATDSSAAVRAAALGSLGKIGGDGALQMVQRAFEQDQSYAVQAAAVEAFSRLDSANATGMVRRALTSPSYQNSVQDAALAVIARQADTNFIAQVDSLIGQQDTPAYVLAVLGSRASPRALDLLTIHLEDVRPQVRRRSLAAFEYAMPPTLALDRLRAARDSVRSPEVRSDIDAAIARLEHAGKK